MIDSIYGEILNEISDGEPYAIYGHSMGSLLAYELAYRLCEDEGVDNRPLKLLVSGRIAPQVKTKNEKNYLLSTEEFKEKILSYGLVSSEEVFKDQKLLDFFIPIMRADFEAVEEYSYLEHKKLNGMFSLNSFPGGHFFIFDDMDRFIRKMEDEMDFFFNIS